MPSLRLFVENQFFGAHQDDLRALLPALRDCLCRELSVAASACQLTVIPVLAPADQPPLLLEIDYLAKPERTGERMTAACGALQAVISSALKQSPPVRALPLEPSTYVAVKGATV